MPPDATTRLADKNTLKLRPLNPERKSLAACSHPITGSRALESFDPRFRASNDLCEFGSRRSNTATLREYAIRHGGDAKSRQFDV
jgi:hypothetical protein